MICGTTTNWKQVLINYNNPIIPSPMPFQNDPKVITDAGSKLIKFVQSADGRLIEYSVHGNLTGDSNTPVIVNPYCAEYLILNKDPDASLVDYDTASFKLISISLPGIGHSDLHPGLKIIEWPTTDLLPILEQEGVNKFIMCGASLGSQYAIATGQVLGDRVLSLGLRVPFLNLPLSESLGLPRGQPTLPTSTELMQNTFKVRFLRFVFSQVTRIYSRPGPCTLKCMQWGLCGAEQAGAARLRRDYPTEFAYLSALAYYFDADAMLHLVALDVCLEAPGLDAREVSAKDIPMNRRLVWYAADDHDCPPSHGQWISETCWKGCRVRVFEGYDHAGAAFLDQTEYYRQLIEVSGLYNTGEDT
jgi:pimeloyl-ACP methyl ester carboxylesterase